MRKIKYSLIDHKKTISTCFFVLMLFLFSCEQKISDNELNTSIKKHKKNRLFMSFYTNMSKKYEDALLEREFNEGKLLKKHEYDVDWFIYPFYYDGYKVGNFNFYYMNDYVLLSSIDKDTINYDIYDYEFKLQRILNILKKKYNQKYKTNYSKFSIVYDSIVLMNKSKVVTITGSYSQSYNFQIQRTEGGSSIDLTYYTKNTFKKVLKEKRQKLLDNQYWKKQAIKELNKKNKNTLKDM